MHMSKDSMTGRSRAWENGTATLSSAMGSIDIKNK